MHWTKHKVAAESWVAVYVDDQRAVLCGVVDELDAADGDQPACRRWRAYYIVGTGVTVVVTYFAARYSGLLAAAASLILSELIMNTYVLPASLKVAEDTWGGFMASMFEYPSALRPKELWRRLRREREMPGDHGEMEI